MAGRIGAMLLLMWLASCSTARTLDMPKPVERESPINSLALEQCVRENGAERCSAESE